MNRLLTIAFFFCSATFCSGQSLAEYVDRIFLGMLSGKPDTSISSFIHKYAPIYYLPYDSTTQWTAYPDDFHEPTYYTVENSFLFSTHPHLNFRFSNGRLEITQKIYSDTTWINNVQQIRLVLQFDNFSEAKKAYKIFIDTLLTFQVLQNIKFSKGIYKAEFSDKPSTSNFGQIEIMMSEDKLNGKRLVFPTKKGLETRIVPGYTMIIKPFNDLY